MDPTSFTVPSLSIISVARGGGGGAGGQLPPIILFRSFVGTFWNLSVHVLTCTDKFQMYRQSIWCTDKILKEIAVLECKNAKISYARSHMMYIDFLNVSVLSVYCRLYTVRIKKKVIHIQRPIVLKSINLNICMWPISKEQLIYFPLVPLLHHVCHAWPSTLPLKMTMSYPTFCKFW